MEILLVDDHALFREGLVMVLKKIESEAAVYEVESGEEALKLAASGPDLDIILLDQNLADTTGLVLLPQLKELLPACPVVMLSAEEEPALIQRALEAGASGFITKTSTSEVMVSAIKLVLTGGIYVPPAILAKRPTAVQARPAIQTPIGSGQPRTDYQLTARQTDVLKEMVKGLSNKEIARELTMSPSTVKVHVAAILRELNVKNRTQVVTIANEAGLLL